MGYMRSVLSKKALDLPTAPRQGLSRRLLAYSRLSLVLHRGERMLLGKSHPRVCLAIRTLPWSRISRRGRLDAGHTNTSAVMSNVLSR